MNNPEFNRRHTLQGLLAISAAGALAACKNTTPSLDDRAADGNFFTAKELALITAISDVIIPNTDTPGAIAAGVVETIQALATEWADDNFRNYWRSGLKSLNKDLLDFVNLSFSQKEVLLQDYDTKVFGGQVQDGFYRDMKSTIASAYYLSEIGATQDLAYEAVPGEWIGCVDLADFPKTWATQ